MPIRTSSPSRTNAFAWSIPGARDADAGVEQRRVVGQLRGRAGHVVRLRRREEADAHAAPGGLLDALDHPPVGDVGVDDVERLARARRGGRAISAVIGRYLPGALCRTVAGTEPGRRRGREKSASSSPGGTAPPSQRKLARKTSWSCETTGPVSAEEEVVEAAVVEVVLDPGAADPADPAVDDEELAMVEVTELRRRPQPRRAHDADVDPAVAGAGRRTRGPSRGRGASPIRRRRA